MIPVSKETKEDMERMGLLEPEAVRDGNGNSIWYEVKDPEYPHPKGDPKFRKSIKKKVHVASNNKNSKGKSYYVEEPIYKKYLFLKSKQTK